MTTEGEIKKNLNPQFLGGGGVYAEKTRDREDNTLKTTRGNTINRSQSVEIVPRKSELPYFICHVIKN